MMASAKSYRSTSHPNHTRFCRSLPFPVTKEGQIKVSGKKYFYSTLALFSFYIISVLVCPLTLTLLTTQKLGPTSFKIKWWWCRVIETPANHRMLQSEDCVTLCNKGKQMISSLPMSYIISWK